MDRLIAFPLDDAPGIARLRATVQRDPASDSAATALGIALAGEGCSYEAAVLLRPRRAIWKNTPEADMAKTALDAQTWWNKNWRAFAQLSQANKREDALALLGNRAVGYWDQPGLLMHLGGFAAETNRFDLAEHIFRRVSVLAERGLPKMTMTAFAYAGPAALVDILARRGRPDEALAQLRDLTPNHGNAMAHEIQTARLQVLAGQIDAALETTARLLVTALSERTGYSSSFRLDTADLDPDFAPLREHAEWAALRADPKGWLRAKSG